MYVSKYTDEKNSRNKNIFYYIQGTLRQLSRLPATRRALGKARFMYTVPSVSEAASTAVCFATTAIHSSSSQVSQSR